MLEPSDLLLMFTGGWGIAYSIVSGTIQGEISNMAEMQEAQQKFASGEIAEMPAIRYSNEYFGQTDGKAGPANLYKLIRWLLWRSGVEFIQEAGYCRVCISLWACGFIGLLLLFDNLILDFMAYSLAANGIVIIYGNVVRVVTAKSPEGSGGWLINDF